MNRETREARQAEEPERILASVLDEIIPSRDDGSLQGAGALGLASRVREALERTPDLRAMVVQGLSALAERAAERSPEGFDALPREQRVELLNELASGHPGFLPTLVFHTYAAYYVDARVVAALGLEPRPPHPVGYEMEPNDLTLLDPVRQGPRRFREC